METLLTEARAWVQAELDRIAARRVLAARVEPLPILHGIPSQFSDAEATVFQALTEAERKPLRAHEVAHKAGYGETTVRRILSAFAKAKIVRKVRGGYVLNRSDNM